MASQAGSSTRADCLAACCAAAEGHQLGCSTSEHRRAPRRTPPRPHAPVTRLWTARRHRSAGDPEPLPAHAWRLSTARRMFPALGPSCLPQPAQSYERREITRGHFRTACTTQDCSQAPCREADRGAQIVRCERARRPVDLLEVHCDALPRLAYCLPFDPPAVFSTRSRSEYRGRVSRRARRPTHVPIGYAAHAIVASMRFDCIAL